MAPIQSGENSQSQGVPTKTSSTLSHPQSPTPEYEDMAPSQSGDYPQNQGFPTKPDYISSNTTHPQLPTPEYEYMTSYQI